MLDLAGVGAGTRLLEIGSGWGALAIRAGQRGAQRHLDHAVAGAAAARPERVEAAGLADRVEIRVQDYREVQGASTPSSASR